MWSLVNAAEFLLFIIKGLDCRVFNFKGSFLLLLFEKEKKELSRRHRCCLQSNLMLRKSGFLTSYGAYLL